MACKAQPPQIWGRLWCWPQGFPEAAPVKGESQAISAQIQGCSKAIPAPRRPVSLAKTCLVPCLSVRPFPHSPLSSCFVCTGVSPALHWGGPPCLSVLLLPLIPPQASPSKPFALLTSLDTASWRNTNHTRTREDWMLRGVQLCQAPRRCDPHFA